MLQRMGGDQVRGGENESERRAGEEPEKLTEPLNFSP